jgi:uncharacterized membrane protein
MSLPLQTSSFLAGLSTGLRTFTATSVTLASERSAWTGLAGTLAAGELVGDKLPMTPARTEPVGLLARAGAAAYCGTLLAKRDVRSPMLGACVAVAAAIAAAFAGYHLRAFVGKQLGIPDPVVALAEDGIAYGLARLANT